MRGYACRGLTLSIRRPGCNSRRLHFSLHDPGEKSIPRPETPRDYYTCRLPWRFSTTETQKAYLAGLIDGEGSVTLSRTHKNEMPSPQLTITNTNLSLLEWVRRVSGCGKIIHRSRRRPNHKLVYMWCVGKTDKCLDALQTVWPYLRIKRRQARLLLTRYKAMTPRNGKYTAVVLRKKLQLVADIRALNRRSIDPIAQEVSTTLISDLVLTETGYLNANGGGRKATGIN